MTKPSISLVFFGTGPVSLVTLQALAAQFTIEAVITKPDSTWHGKTTAPPVKDWAVDQQIAVYQPADRAALTALIETQPFTSAIGIAIDYGLIMDKSVIESFPKRIINSHFSLLPRWRGADPIRAALLAGDQVTGISLFLIEPQLDTGPLLTQAKLTIDPHDTYASLRAKLMALSNQLLVETLPRYFDGHLSPRPQPTAGVTYAPKLHKSDGLIDWTKPASQLEREVRAYLGWPGSYTTLKKMNIIITQSTVVTQQGPIGELTVENDIPMVHAGRDSLRLDRIKPAGKTEMSGTDFARGYLR
ncbi:methionyl-tRNA formyltransferase [Candidatus Microgenomates bacterium]|nr:methionyl-tRNA formyltransferase [Candidatus Microgenomates bacterium]